jgi:hypothetical protein
MHHLIQLVQELPSIESCIPSVKVLDPFEADVELGEVVCACWGLREERQFGRSESGGLGQLLAPWLVLYCESDLPWRVLVLEHEVLAELDYPIEHLGCLPIPPGDISLLTCKRDRRGNHRGDSPQRGFGEAPRRGLAHTARALRVTDVVFR